MPAVERRRTSAALARSSRSARIRRATTGALSDRASSPAASDCRPESSCCGRSSRRRSASSCSGARWSGVVTQFFLNMEVERYTLATGETAVTGFNRFWKHWGLVFAVLAYFANLWPGWAISAATLGSYLFGGDAADDRDRHAPHHRLFADVRAGHLRGARAPDFRESRGCADSRDPRDDLRHRARVVARAAGGLAELRQDSRGAEHCADLRRDRLRRIGRRAEPVSEQLDSRQRVRHGAVRSEAREPDHGDGHGRARPCRATSSSRRPPTWRGGTAGGASRTSSRCSASCS